MITNDKVIEIFCVLEMKNKLMPMYDKIMLRKRYIIECINDALEEQGEPCTFKAPVHT